MNIRIIEVKTHTEGLEITAIVFPRYLPPPRNDGETNEEYSARVESIAKEIANFNNLHVGWAELTQDTHQFHIPTIDEYYS